MTTQGGSRADGPLLGTQPRSEVVDALAHAIGGALNRRPRGDLERSAVEIIVSVLHRHLPAILAERQGALLEALERRSRELHYTTRLGSHGHLGLWDKCEQEPCASDRAALAQPAEHGGPK